MKLTIGDYEVEIKAKSAYATKANKNDTMNLLNELAIALSEAYLRDKELGLFGMANANKELHDDIYNFLDKNGAYK